MSDNIPFEIQIEIIKHVPGVKSLLRFRSVSKPWKSFIDSYKFTHHIEPHRSILRYKDSLDSLKENYICVMDDTLTRQQELDPIVPVLIKELNDSKVVGSCNGVFCVRGVNNGREMVVLWNPSIRKCVGMLVPHVPYNRFLLDFGFGVCPVTNDPTIVRFQYDSKISLQVEVFTLSSGVWNVIPSSNLPRESIRIMSASHVVIDRFIHWAAYERIVDDNGVFEFTCRILSFNMITKDLKVVDVPCNVVEQVYGGITISKLRESLVLLGTDSCVWMMEHDGVLTSFRKLYTFDIPDLKSIVKIHGYRKSGEPIIEFGRYGVSAAIEVYSPSSKHIHNPGIYGRRHSFFMGSYMDTLLLLDHADCFIYDYILRSDLLPNEGGAKLVIR